MKSMRRTDLRDMTGHLNERMEVIRKKGRTEGRAKVTLGSGGLSCCIKWERGARNAQIVCQNDWKSREWKGEWISPIFIQWFLRMYCWWCKRDEDASSSSSLLPIIRVILLFSVWLPSPFSHIFLFSLFLIIIPFCLFLSTPDHPGLWPEDAVAWGIRNHCHKWISLIITSHLWELDKKE